MEAFSASKTALATSRIRAIHARSDPAPIFNDPWGDRLVPARVLLPPSATGEREKEAGPEAFQQILDAALRASAGYTNVIVRARYTEDALGSAIAEGVKQYVMIGAGFDSYALRKPAAAQHLDVFEVDHPATQALKIRRFHECNLSCGDRHYFLAADLGEEDLESVLSRSSFDFREPAFFSWLGVTMYLTAESNMATLASVARFGAAGSQLVFSYLDQTLFDTVSGAEKDLFAELEQSVKDLGEPFVSGFDKTALARDLARIGLAVEEDLDDVHLVDRYDPAGANGFTPSDKSRIARVRVLGG